MLTKQIVHGLGGIQLLESLLPGSFVLEDIWVPVPISGFCGAIKKLKIPIGNKVELRHFFFDLFVIWRVEESREQRENRI